MAEQRKSLSRPGFGLFSPPANCLVQPVAPRGHGDGRKGTKQPTLPQGVRGCPATRKPTESIAFLERARGDLTCELSSAFPSPGHGGGAGGTQHPELGRMPAPRPGARLALPACGREVKPRRLHHRRLRRGPSTPIPTGLVLPRQQPGPRGGTETPSAPAASRFDSGRCSGPSLVQLRSKHSPSHGLYTSQVILK